MRNKNFDAMRHFLLMMLAVFISFIPNFIVAQITRTQIINNATPYTSLQWTATSSNIQSTCATISGRYYKTPTWVTVGSKTSVPYKWDGFTNVNVFANLAVQGKKAGNYATTDVNSTCPQPPYESDSDTYIIGVDCSGFVSRAWALSSKYGTSTLPSISTEINYSQLQPGDIVNKVASHTRLIKTYYQNGSAEVIEASGRDWKTSTYTYTPIQQTGYTARVYNNVSGGGTPPGSFTLTLTPECSGTRSQITLNWTPSSGVASYDVYRDGIKYASDIQGTQYINYGSITVGASYSYYVQAKNSYGSKNSNTQSATAPNCSDNPPIVSSFSINPNSITLGSTFSFSYSVTDDVGLSRVELWRTTDLNNSPNGNGWNRKYTTNLSGQKSFSGSFTDSPSSQGTYWYGIHAVDTKNQVTYEPTPPGPLKGIVSSTQYSVNLSSNPSSGGTTSGGGTYNSGQSVTVTATPNSGYTFTNWTESGSVISTSSSYTFTITSDRTLVANFSVIPPTQYSVNLSSNPSNGGTTSGGGTYNSGQSVTVTATPNSGYNFVNWKEGSNVVSSNASYPFTISGDRTLVANFSVIPHEQYSVNLSSNPSNGGTTSGGGTYNSGQSVTVTATPNSGYTFTNWTENGTQVSTSSSYNFTISSNRTLAANFTVIPPAQYSVNLSSNPSNGGTTSGGGTYNSGQSVTVTATPNSGYTFTNWTENGSVISTSSSYTFTITTNRTLVANFTATPCDPNWTPVTYTNSTTAYGIVTISSSPAASGDKVGAFVGSVCRGVGTVTTNQGSAYVTIIIQGDNVETVGFKIFRTSECKIYEVGFTTSTSPGNTIGNNPNYLPIASSSNVTQNINLTTGWNYISFYVHAQDMTPSNVFSSISSSLSQVKNLSQSYDPTVPDFLNTLTSLQDGYGYLVKLKSSAGLSVSGSLVGSISIPLTTGWNLIGHPKQNASPVTTVFASIMSNISQIKSVNKSYDPSVPDFLNTLSQMEPGQGYFIKMKNNSTINFSVVSQNKIVGKDADNLTEEGNRVVTYTNSTTVYGEISYEGMEKIKYVEAMVKGECRAIGEVVLAEGKYYVTLIVNGETEEPAEFNLYGEGDKLLGKSTNKLITKPGETLYHKILFDDKEDIHTKIASGLTANKLYPVYPNPFNPTTLITFELVESSPVELTVYNINGELVKRILSQNLSNGHYTYEWDGKNDNGGKCSSGIYLLRMITKQAVASQKLFLIK